MDDAKQVLYSITQTIKDRFGNPLIGSFIITWCIWNYRTLLVIVGSGDGGWEKKIEYISHKLYPTGNYIIFDGFIAPLIGTAIWLFALPWFLKHGAIFHERRRNDYKKAMYEVSGEETLTASQARAHREEMLDQLSKTINQREQNSRVVSDQMNANIELTTSIERLNNEITRKNENISALDEKNLNLKNKNTHLENENTILKQYVNGEQELPAITFKGENFSDEEKINLMEEIGIERAFPVREYAVNSFPREIILPFIAKRSVYFASQKIIRANCIVDDELILFCINFEKLTSSEVEFSMSIDDFTHFTSRLPISRPDYIAQLLIQHGLCQREKSRILLQNRIKEAGNFYRSIGFRNHEPNKQSSSIKIKYEPLRD